MDYREGIRKTGFVLEFTVAETLREHGWTLLTNRYYIDDAREIEREIDIIAYRSTPGKDVLFFTVLVISCKKSEENVWAFLTRADRGDDINFEYNPIHCWSNDPVLSYMINQEPVTLAETQLSAGPSSSMDVYFNPEYRVFGFQELKRASGNPQNDKPIYDSISQLLKALAHEVTALSARKREQKFFYEFHLVTVCDTEMLRFPFTSTEVPPPQPCSLIVYVNRHFVNRKDRHYRIIFVQEQSFPKLVQDFGNLHSMNKLRVKATLDEFYGQAYENTARRSVLAPEFKRRFALAAAKEASRQAQRFASVLSDEVHLYYHEPTASATVTVSSSDADVIHALDSPSLLREAVALLRDIYKFEGDVRVHEDDIPF